MAVALLVHVDQGEAALGHDDGRGWAFEAMYRRFYPDVVALCRRLLGRTGDAEATAQEAFIRAWAALDRYSTARPFWPWISAIAQRLCFDHRRRSIRESRRMELGESLTQEPQPEIVVEAGEDLRVVFRAIDRLRPHERRALMLREIDGWSYEQIAAFEGVTIESVRGSLKRARATVRRRLAGAQ
jgi:RNA polymerase sigma-70 factor (ECF subfamily)